MKIHSDNFKLSAGQKPKAGFCDGCGMKFSLNSLGDIIEEHWTFDVKQLCRLCCENLIEEQLAFYKNPA